MTQVINKKNLPKSSIHLTITADAKDFRHAFDHEINEYSQNVKIQGFRPGKAPRAKVIEKIGRQALEGSALDHMLNHSYGEATQNEGIYPVSQPDVKVVSYQTPGENDPENTEVLKFEVTVDILPKVDAKNYTKVHIKKPSSEPVLKSDLDKVFDYLRRQQGVLKELDDKETTAKNGMWLDIAYEGSVGGVKRTDMANKNHPLVLGENTLIPGFEEKIVGMKVGETKTISLSFPKEYHAKELAGKKAEFVTTINEMKEMALPDMDEEFAKQFGHESIEKLTEAIEKDLRSEKDQEMKQKIETMVVEDLLKNIRFDIPQSLVEREVERQLEDSKHRLSEMKMDWNTYLAQTNQTEDKVKSDMSVQAEKNVRLGLILGEVIKAEGIPDGNDAGRLAMNKLVDIATK